MDRNKTAPQRATMEPFQELRIDRADQPQYSKTFDVDQHIRAINRAMIDAYVMLKDWPFCIRYSDFLGPDGKLMTRAERRGGK